MPTSDLSTLIDIGDIASVPPEERADVDDPDDNGLGESGPEDVSDVPEGDPEWIDPEGDTDPATAVPRQGRHR
ncbi:MAG: hypothetical protein M3Q27_14580 [Actinomycetota bacterium]|nr:hypothetical protein [Actinomycetota bacterium]